jgi:Uma2 family endonuclease
MAVMRTEVIEGSFTYADLERMPDDGRRREIIDGTLIVNASPSYDHQGVVGNFYLLLRTHAPAEFGVIGAPFDVVLADDTVVEPDLVVARREAFTQRNLPGPPDLVVEVLSPSTRGIDLSTKRDRFEEAGIVSYWIVDPRVPRLRALELRAGRYVELADVSGDEVFVARLPFEVTVVPSQLPY